MSQEQNVHFKELNLKEVKSKLALLAKPKKNKIIIWKKGGGNKVELLTIDYVRSKNELQVKEKVTDELIGEEVLFSFELNGLHFFGKCKPVSFGKTRFYLDCNYQVFKSERRLNFRLLTYPHQKVYASVYVGDDKIKASNLFSLKTGVNETGLFTSFLDIVNDEASEEKLKMVEGHLQFRVIDISVTGMAILLGEIESKLFLENNINLGKVIIDFNGDHLEIEDVKLLYKMDFLASRKATKMYKAGLQFLNIDTNLDEKLQSIINSTLRDLEAEFEDFIR